MTALYLITFADGIAYYVNSADARSMKRAAISAAYTKARKKARAKRKAAGLGRSPVAASRCVG